MGPTLLQLEQRPNPRVLNALVENTQPSQALPPIPPVLNAGEANTWTLKAMKKSQTASLAHQARSLRLWEPRLSLLVSHVVRANSRQSKGVIRKTTACGAARASTHPRLGPAQPRPASHVVPEPIPLCSERRQMSSACLVVRASILHRLAIKQRQTALPAVPDRTLWSQGRLEQARACRVWPASIRRL